MEKLYDRINWHNNTNPAINESNLNRMDKALDDIDDRVVELGGDVLVVVPQIMTYLAQAQDLYEAMENLSKHPPYIGENGHWYVWDIPTASYVDSGIDASITVQIQDITMLNYGVAPYVTNTGTDTDPVFHLFIPRAASIDHVSKTGTLVLVDTYTITMQDGNTHTFTVTNGRGITQIEKTHTAGAVDTYTISYNDNTTSTFEVTNGQGFGDMTQAAYDSDYEVVNLGGIKSFLESRIVTDTTYVEDGGIPIFNEEEGRYVPDRPSLGVAYIKASLNQGDQNYTDPLVDCVHVEGYGSTAGSRAPDPSPTGDEALRVIHASALGEVSVYNFPGTYTLNLDGEFTSLIAYINKFDPGPDCYAEAFSSTSIYREELSTSSWKSLAYMNIRYEGGSPMSWVSTSLTFQVMLVSKTGDNYVVQFRLLKGEIGGTIPAGSDCSCNYELYKEYHDPVGVGLAAHAEGYLSAGLGDYTHAEGQQTYAVGKGSHTEGFSTCASGQYAHAEGSKTTAIGADSHAEGSQTYAAGENGHAEGLKTTAHNASHSEGSNTFSWNSSHAEGSNTNARGYDSHSEGLRTYAGGNYSHAEGYYTCTVGEAAHSEGYKTTAKGNYSHAEGQQTCAGGNHSHAEGYGTSALQTFSFAGGYGSSTNVSYSFAFGYNAQTNRWSRNADIQDTVFAVGALQAQYTKDRMTRAMMDSTDINPEADTAAYNAFSVDNSGNVFTTGERYLLRGCIRGRLAANQDTIVLEDGAVYELITNTRLNNGTFRGATTYTVIATWAMDPSVGTTTTAQAIPQLITDGNVGTVGIVISRLAEPYLNINGTTAYHSKLGIACCVNTCRVRYTLKKISGSIHDFDVPWV